ncbi:MAG: hypothetical protein AVDCRST_MAG12-3014, partial [uncultured Rubrobacteraceae bacterium]
ERETRRPRRTGGDARGRPAPLSRRAALGEGVWDRRRRPGPRGRRRAPRGRGWARPRHARAKM